MQTTATQTATRTSPYQTRSKTTADMMDENELLHAQLVRLEARVKYPCLRFDIGTPVAAAPVGATSPRAAVVCMSRCECPVLF